ncbi:MAG: polysaccharide lyase family 7 protein [Saprospiraceae bacterium]|nr:polysaccharide lyase family 7 protein [Saprospiraceae bacterium]
MQRFYYIFVIFAILSCANEAKDEIALPDPPAFPDITQDDEEEPDPSASYSNIDLNNWKVTLPIPRSTSDSRPLEITPPEILNYPNVEALKDFMFDDTEEGAIVFYTTPGVSTTNSSYSRTELREQLQPGSNSVNWTFAEGGTMQGKLRVSNVSGNTGNLDRIIIMQIHGRLSNEQRDLIGEDDNNAPPVVKVYWDDGKINFRRKVLVDESVNDIDVLRTSAWEDESHWFNTEVGFEPFELKITAANNYLKCEIIGTEEVFEFSDVHTQRWGVFENYFKAGNYLISTDEDAFSEVKYYELDVQH